MNGGWTWAHVIMPALAIIAVVVAWLLGFPHVCTLFGIYMISGIALYQLLGRLSQSVPWRRFGDVGRVYALLIGLTSFYFASDAYVLERAFFSYPVAPLGFVGFGLAIAGLTIVTMMRRSTPVEIYVTHPGFVSIGIAIFVAAVTLQLIAMTALIAWPFQAVAYRVIFIAGALWLAQMGVTERSPSTIISAVVFSVIGLMTAYLDLLWPYRGDTLFLAGAGVLFVGLAGAGAIWARQKITALRPGKS